jgi:hypothetical protein
MTFARTLLAVTLTIALASAHRAVAQDDKPVVSTTKPSTQSSAGPIDYQKLKEALPAELAGMTRSELTGEKTGFGEIKFSTARATYVKDADKDDAPRIDLQLQDYGANSPMLAGMTAWTQAAIEREGDDGFQKTTKIQDQPAMLMYANEGKTGTAQLLVGGRFMMTVTTVNMSAEQFKKIGDELKLKEVAALAK